MMWHMDGTGGDTPAIVDPDTWQPILTWLGEAGMKLLTCALIIVGAILASWVLRLVIHRVVERIVSGAKTKANVDLDNISEDGKNVVRSLAEEAMKGSGIDTSGKTIVIVKHTFKDIEW